MVSLPGDFRSDMQAESAVGAKRPPRRITFDALPAAAQRSLGCLSVLLGSTAGWLVGGAPRDALLG